MKDRADKLFAIALIKGTAAISEILWIVVLLSNDSDQFGSNAVFLWTSFVMVTAVGRAGADLEFIKNTKLLTEGRKDFERSILLTLLRAHTALTFKLSILLAVAYSFLGATALTLVWCVFTPTLFVATSIIADYFRAKQRFKAAVTVAGPAIWLPPLAVACLSHQIGMNLDVSEKLVIFLTTTATLFLTLFALIMRKERENLSIPAKEGLYFYDARAIKILSNARSRIRIFSLLVANIAFWILSFSQIEIDVSVAYTNFRIASGILLTIYAVDIIMYPDMTLSFVRSGVDGAISLLKKYVGISTTSSLVLAIFIYAAALLGKSLEPNFGPLNSDNELLFSFLIYFVISAITAPYTAFLIVAEKANIAANLYLANAVSISAILVFTPHLISSESHLALVLIAFAFIRLAVSAGSATSISKESLHSG